MLDCARCGMSYETNLRDCPKCDFGRHEQNQRATFTQDIAHNRQTLQVAENEFYDALESAKRQGYGHLRLIVGGGKIKVETQKLLDAAIWQGRILGYETEHKNNGAFLVKLG